MLVVWIILRGMKPCFCVKDDCREAAKVLDYYQK